MTTVTVEQIHRYPRRIRWTIEFLVAVAVALTTFLAGRMVLRYLWHHYDVDDYVLKRSPLLRSLVDWLDVQRLSEIPLQPVALLPPLLLLAGTLLAALFLRNAFPTVRTSGRGMLVEFAGSWLPIRWEDIAVIKATESPAGQRYVLLVQTRNQTLTGWHRLYSFVYRLGWQRGFLITSSIHLFDTLIKTILHESDRTANLLNLQPAQLDERSTSPLFQFLLSPVGFFSRRTAAEETVAAASGTVDQTLIEAFYPKRIKYLLGTATLLLVALAVLRYLGYWRRFIGSVWPNGPAFFQQAAQPAPESHWWLLAAAHLMLVLLVPVLIFIWTLLPDMRAQPDGLAIRYFRRWIVLPWQRITRIDAADLSEHNHVLLIEGSRRNLPVWNRLVGLLFDGRGNPGILITSAISNFEPLLQRVLLAVSRSQPADPEHPIFHDNAPAWGIRLLLTPSNTISRLVSEAREDPETQTIMLRRALGLFRVPLALALLPVLVLMATLLIERALLPTPARLGVLFAFLIWGMLEWPLIATLATAVENNPGLDAEQARPFYLYPIVQIPRLIPMALAMTLALLSVDYLPTLLWLGAAIWSFLLTAALWEELYGWHGSKLLLMGMAPAVFQILSLLAYGILI
ncbi:MAG: hypothetical protein KatS3mg057_2556 [Herpetosiphonaceae bacterium]|nr:MAG: hypothetical protein KatS3mg057_2556 [Herpetosiphonaceae bacterium]